MIRKTENLRALRLEYLARLLLPLALLGTIACASIRPRPDVEVNLSEYQYQGDTVEVNSTGAIQFEIQNVITGKTIPVSVKSSRGTDRTYGSFPLNENSLPDLNAQKILQEFSIKARGSNVELSQKFWLIADHSVIVPKFPFSTSPAEAALSGLQAAEFLAKEVISSLRVKDASLESIPGSSPQGTILNDSTRFLEFKITGEFPEYVVLGTDRTTKPKELKLIISEENPALLINVSDGQNTLFAIRK